MILRAPSSNLKLKYGFSVIARHRHPPNGPACCRRIQHVKKHQTDHKTKLKSFFPPPPLWAGGWGRRQRAGQLGGWRAITLKLYFNFRFELGAPIINA